MNMNAGWRNRDRSAFNAGAGVGQVGRARALAPPTRSHFAPTRTARTSNARPIGPASGHSQGSRRPSMAGPPTQHQQHPLRRNAASPPAGTAPSASGDDNSPAQRARHGWADAASAGSSEKQAPADGLARVKRLSQADVMHSAQSSPMAGSNRDSSMHGVPDPQSSAVSRERAGSGILQGSAMGSAMTGGSRIRRQPTDAEYTSALLQLTTGSFRPHGHGMGPSLGADESHEGSMSLVDDTSSHASSAPGGPAARRINLLARNNAGETKSGSDPDHRHGAEVASKVPQESAAPRAGSATPAGSTMPSPTKFRGSAVSSVPGSSMTGGMGAGEAAAIEVDAEESARKRRCQCLSRCWGKSKSPKALRAVPTSAFTSVMSEAAGAKEHNAVISKKCIIDPRVPWLRKWELILVAALVYTATVTPFDVAFLDPSAFTILFWINRMVDALFGTDIIMNFFTAVPGDPQLNTQWIQDYSKIAYRYLTGWFVVDLLSVFPFDMVSLFFDADELRHLQAIRTLRLLRLAKLFRVLRAVRIFRRWESSLNINYSLIGLAQFVILMGVSSHWLACLWRLIVEFEPNQWDSWLGQAGLLGSTADVQYVAALYWAVMTLSTIGYGDIAANTTLERATALFCMLLGSSIWAYIVGSICGIVSSLDAESLSFRRNMDELNYFMAEEHLPKEMRQRLREYFHQRRALTRALSHQSLLVQMSPSLRQEVAFHTNRRWLRHVSWFQKASKDFVSAVAVHLQPAVYAPKELLHGDEFSIVVRGVAAKDGQILTQGNTWGDDIILTGMEFRRATPARALTYLEVKSMSQDDLYGVLAAFPEEAVRIRRIANRLALRRAFVREAKRRVAEKRMLEQEADRRRRIDAGLSVSERSDEDDGDDGSQEGTSAPSTARSRAPKKRKEPVRDEDEMPLRPAYRPGMTTVPIGGLPQSVSQEAFYPDEGGAYNSQQQMPMAGMLVPVVVPKPNGAASVLSRYSDTDSQASGATSQADIGEMVRTAVTNEMERAVRETLQSQTAAVRSDIQNMVAALRASHKFASSVRSDGSGNSSASSSMTGFRTDAGFVQALRSVATAAPPAGAAEGRPPLPDGTMRRAYASDGVEKSEDAVNGQAGYSSQDERVSRGSAAARLRVSQRGIPRRIRHTDSTMSEFSNLGIADLRTSKPVPTTSGAVNSDEDADDRGTGVASPSRDFEIDESVGHAHAQKIPGFSGPSMLAFDKASSHERATVTAGDSGQAPPLAGLQEVARGAGKARNRTGSSLIVRPPPK